MQLSRVLLVALAVVGACAGSAPGATDNDVYIYKGGPLSQEKIEASSWGSGKSVESKEKVLTGGQSIKITTQGPYAGGRLDFDEAVPLFSGGVDKKRYIVFSFFFPDVQTIEPAANTASAFDVEPYTVPRVSKVRLVFVSNTGVKVSLERPTNPLDPDDNWVRMAVPLAKLDVPEGTSEFRLKRLIICTDIPGTLYLGEAKIVTDNVPIKVDSLGVQTVAVYDDVFLVANATGGVSSLKYAWDYDSSNGLQVESTTKVGRYVYLRGGDFTVTLTVSDIDGLKEPVVVTGTISVTD